MTTNVHIRGPPPSLGINSNCMAEWATKQEVIGCRHSFADPCKGHQWFAPVPWVRGERGVSPPCISAHGGADAALPFSTPLYVSWAVAWPAVQRYNETNGRSFAAPSTHHDLLYRDPLFLEHDTGHHPENANRLRSIQAGLTPPVWTARCTPLALSSAAGGGIDSAGSTPQVLLGPGSCASTVAVGGHARQPRLA